MTELRYRLYCMSDGRIVGTEEFQAAHDMGALQIARSKPSRYDCELWCGDRLVGFIPAALP